ncbi:MAG: AI-2E family transporter [Bacteroidota bacterium]
MSASRTLNVLLILIAVVFILVMTKSFLIPFVLALLIWYIIREIRGFLRKNSFIRTRLPIWLQNTLAFLLISLTIGLAIELLENSARNFSRVIPTYQANIEALNGVIKDRFEFDLLQELSDRAVDLNFEQYITPIINNLSSLLGDFFMIILYCIFILLEESTFRKKLPLMFANNRQYSRIMGVLEEIDVTFGKYISLKTFVSLLTGVLSYIILLIIGVDSPVLWAFIIFLLNYIPSIGSLIGTLFPVIVAILQFGEFLPGLYVLIGVGIVQVVIGNVVEPRIMGNSLNISPLVVIVSLIAWGAIWGVVGMVLSVPIMVMLIIIFAQFPSTEDIAILLSDTGELHMVKAKNEEGTVPKKKGISDQGKTAEGVSEVGV